jgi:organic radical activating enzyme
MKKTYKVNEIFYSLQGEGFYTGTAAVFLRFSGCNRACDFCDTAHQTFTEMTLDEIVKTVSSHPARHIVITGGEPTLQLDDELIRALKGAGFYIQIETNGSLPVPSGVDWVTCSPKDAPWHIGRIDELKVVYQGQDVEQLASLLPASRHYLQPCSGKNIAETVAYILEHPKWHLSLQTHKLIDIQ